MRKFAFISAVFVFSAAMLFTTVSFAQRGRIDERIRHQWQRIDHAVAAGTISQRQADFLRHHLSHIRHEFESARNSGALDFNTIQQLNRKLDRNSMRIERMERGEGGGGFRPFH